MKKVLLFLPHGFETYEACVFIDVIGWNLVVGDGSTKLFTGGFTREVKSSFDQVFVVDYLIQDINSQEFDALALPGGFEIFDFYREAYDEKFLNLVRTFNSQNKPIAAVCVGSLPIGKSGILQGRKATTYNKMEVRMNTLRSYGVDFVNEPVVTDGNVITSWNPSTAMEVAFLLLERLTSKEQANKIKGMMGFEGK
jgi:4-methyl-5(b-hydroxyethyl)-thiazole monophosphate biosynthesis